MFGRKLGWLSLLVASFLALTTMGSARQCSNATLKGAYTFLEQGTVTEAIVTPPFPVPYPVVITAKATLDGAGHFSGKYESTFDGHFFKGDVSGTYVVTSDCAYSDTFSVTLDSMPGSTFHHTGSISGEGTLQEIRYIYSDEGLAMSGTGKKQ